jgi:hypothetical protein
MEVRLEGGEEGLDARELWAGELSRGELVGMGIREGVEEEDVRR